MSTTGGRGLNRFQREIAEPKPAVVEKVKPYMAAWIRDFISLSPFLVMATANKDGDCDASPRGGLPGFVHVIDDHRLALPDYWGNRLFQSFANIEENPKCGLVFFIPGVNETVRVNGRCTVLTEAQALELGLCLSVHEADAKTSFVQGLLVEVDESYSHCGRSLMFSGLWDVQRIQAHKSERPIAARPPKT